MKGMEPCILCKGVAFRIVHRRGARHYLRCRSCGLVSLYPRPGDGELEQMYQDYLPVTREGIRNWEREGKGVALRAAEIIASRFKAEAGRLLEVGCGLGFFLGTMKMRGWEVEGVEISEAGREFAQRTWKVPVHRGPLDELNLPEESFDAAVLFYVIEHVPDPVGLLTEIGRILKPGGLVLLRWPHTTPIVRMLGPVSRYVDLYHTPYHLYDFSPATMQALLNRCGFGDVETMIGGRTRPRSLAGLSASVLFGSAAEVLYGVSGGQFLLPGVSKTTMARKKRKPNA